MKPGHVLKLPKLWFRIHLYFWGALLLTPSPLYGKTERSSIGNAIVKNNIKISNHIDDLASQLDQLLANRKYRKRKNKTALVLTSIVDSREGAKPVSSGHIDLNLRLPTVEKELKILLSSYDRENENLGLNRNRPGAQYGEQRLGVGVLLGQQFGKVRTSFRPRIELKDPLISSFLLKFQNTIPFKNNLIRQQLKLFVHSKDGSGQALSFDMDCPLGWDLVFRFINEQQYLDRINTFSTSHGPALLYRVSESIGLSTSLIFNSSNRPNFGLRNYLYLITLRQQIFKKILAYQITPSLTFAKSRNFKGEAGINFRLELTF